MTTAVPALPDSSTACFSRVALDHASHPATVVAISQADGRNRTLAAIVCLKDGWHGTSVLIRYVSSEFYHALMMLDT